MPLKSSTVPESSILSCLDIYSPGKVSNSDSSYGYCYDITLLSLSHITRYKSKRKEPNTDDYDIKLIQSFMKNCIPWNNSSGINNDNNTNIHITKKPTGIM
jgi:hypothetical protein